MWFKAFALELNKNKSLISFTLLDEFFLFCARYVQQTQQTPVAEPIVFIHSWWIINRAPDKPAPQRSQGWSNYSQSLTSLWWLFSCIRCRSRGGRPKPSRLVAASCRAAKETKGRCGGEIRHPCTVRGVLCCLLTICLLYCTMHTFVLFYIKWATIRPSDLTGKASTSKWMMTSAGTLTSWLRSHTRTHCLMREYWQRLIMICDAFICRSEGEDQQVKMKCFR